MAAFTPGVTTSSKASNPQWGNAAVAITAGQAVWNDDGIIRLATNAANDASKGAFSGIALTAAGQGQRVIYAGPGTLTGITTGGTKGTAIRLAAGGAMDDSAIGSGYFTICGILVTATDMLIMDGVTYHK